MRHKQNIRMKHTKVFVLLLVAVLAPTVCVSLATQRKVAGHPQDAVTPGVRSVQPDDPAQDDLVLNRWIAGRCVSRRSVEAYGLSRCFAESPIDSVLYRRILGRSYKRGCAVPLSDLRYLRLLHCTADGHVQLGELICNRSVSADLLYIFRRLFDAGYPIERVTLIDGYGADDERSMAANNTSCFNYRPVANSTRLSKHSLGKAIDINPLYNPCVRRLRGGRVTVSPQAGKVYADRTRQFPYKIDTADLCYRLFVSRGFTWGGHWKSVKDYQHFEKP